MKNNLDILEKNIDSVLLKRLLIILCCEGLMNYFEKYKKCTRIRHYYSSQLFFLLDNLLLRDMDQAS